MPPHDESSWSRAIQRVVKDEALRRDLRARGAATVEKYSWERTARGVLDLFGSVALP